GPAACRPDRSADSFLEESISSDRSAGFSGTDAGRSGRGAGFFDRGAGDWEWGVGFPGVGAEGIVTKNMTKALFFPARVRPGRTAHRDKKE
ncbi:MAG: hypothetical protein LUG50_14525, partial [Planctomycetaceae bacterium]|nr:hypothetical protein [Planctomycetaceae bacterium]